MPRPTSARDAFCAAHHGWRVSGSAAGWRVSGAVPGRAVIVLLGVILLCGASAVREFELSIRDRRVEGSVSTLRVKRGETVLLRWRTDEAVSLHVHGYDVQANLSAASPRSVRFDATIAGRFPITAHEFGTADQAARSKGHREVTLLYLEVLPE
jgi:hypothetical protein